MNVAEDRNVAEDMNVAEEASEAQARFAGYVATLGRGPGRSRALTQAEAEDAMGLLLEGLANPVQVGAFLMLLRYRGEDAAEIAGLVCATRHRLKFAGLDVALDWPSYGAGRTRGAPWFLLAALALGQVGHAVFMHGSNEFSAGASVAASLARLGVPVAADAAAAAGQLAARGFAYVRIEDLCPRFAELLGLRRLLGLRSPLNTAARLLNPAGAPAGVDGVFHPPYIDVHMAAAPLLGHRRLLVLKGGGGEAERNPAKPATASLFTAANGRAEITLPALAGAAPAAPEPDIVAIWRGTARDTDVEARIVGTIALGLLAMGIGGDAEAQTLWETRRAGR
jgi:anthranilate phosphoribosyltransferase